MKSLVSKIKPRKGFAAVFHIGLTALLPVIVYVLIRLGDQYFVQIAIAVILLSKWRMLAVRPRHWWPNIRANAVDIIAGLSFLAFMYYSGSAAGQLYWAIIYGIWLIFIKPKSTLFMTSMQAMIAQITGLTALLLTLSTAPLLLLVFGAWLVCYMSARHFFTSFEEPHTPLLAHSWGYFAAALVWVLGHWLLYYPNPNGIVAQPTLMLTIIGYTLATLYYLDHHDRLSKLIRRQFVFLMSAIIVVIIVFSDWGDKAI